MVSFKTRDNRADVFEAMDAVNVLGHISLFIQETLHPQAVDVTGYHCLPPIGADPYDPIYLISSLDCPSEQFEDYKVRKLYRHNPFVMKPLLSAEPLWWTDIIRFPDLTRENLRFVQMVDGDRIGGKLSIPVFGPLGHNGVVSVNFDLKTVSRTNIDVFALQLACQKSHIDICHHLHDSHSKSVTITNREREILDWVILGKSNTAIAYIMGLSPHTVNGYLRSLFLTFNTTDRVSTAIRAIAVGAVY